VIAGQDVAVGQDDEAAAATRLDVIDIDDLFAIDVLEFHVALAVSRTNTVASAGAFARCARAAHGTGRSVDIERPTTPLDTSDPPVGAASSTTWPKFYILAWPAATEIEVCASASRITRQGKQ
jgi:hypothetical protein